MNIENYATSKGNFNGKENELKSNTVITQIVSGMMLLKEADRYVWIDGELNLDMKIQNNSGTTVISPLVTEKLDPTKIRIKDGTIKVNGVNINPSDYTYDFKTGILNIKLEDMPLDSEVKITFKADKISNSWENIKIFFNLEGTLGPYVDPVTYISNTITIISISRGRKMRYLGCDMPCWRI